MPSVSLPVTRSSGTTLVIASPSARPAVLALIEPMQFTCVQADNPYAGMILLCRQSGSIKSIVLSLLSCYREELAFIETVKRRFPKVEVWLTQTDGRHAALIEAMRRGADGLLSEDGLHRIGGVTPTAAEPVQKTTEPQLSEPYSEQDLAMGEPVLSADELRALLHEQPGNPPVHGV